MTFRLEFEIPSLPKRPNELLGAHWRSRSNHKKKWLRLIHLVTLGKRPVKPLEKAKLTLTRFSAVEPDEDGLSGSFKPVVDSLVDLDILIDDRRENTGVPDYRWVKCSPRKGKIQVIVEEIAMTKPDKEREL